MSAIAKVNRDTAVLCCDWLKKPEILKTDCAVQTASPKEA